MAKNKRNSKVSRISSFTADLKNTPQLPSADEVNKRVEEIAPIAEKKVKEKAPAPEKVAKKAPKVTKTVAKKQTALVKLNKPNHQLTKMEGKEGRKRFTTMLRPDLKKRLQNLGNDYNYSIADIIEKAVEQYLEEYKDY